MFESLNDYSNTLHVLEADSAEGLKEMIRQITLPVRIINVYFAGTKHIAWIHTSAIIKRTNGVKSEHKQSRI
jgi:hypothetical protein